MGLEVLYLLIPASVLLALVALALFLWAIRSGQFDDLVTPAMRILFDDEPPGGAAEPGREPEGESDPDPKGAERPDRS